MKKNDLSPEAFRFEGKMSLKQALPLGMQHVLAMFVGNLTPLLIITGACGLAGGEFADLRVTLLQNAMLVAGIVTFGSAVFHRPHRRQGAYHHGHLLRLHRGIQLGRSLDGRRRTGLRRDHGRLPDRRPV